MSDLRGIARLDWLEEIEHVTISGMVLDLPRQQRMDSKIVAIHVARALIEELHDAIAFWSSPQVVAMNFPDIQP